MATHWDLFDALSRAVWRSRWEQVIKLVDLWAPNLPTNHSTSASTCFMYLASSQDCLKQEFPNSRAFWLPHLLPYWSPVLIPLIWLARQVSPPILTAPRALGRSKQPSQTEEDLSLVKGTWVAALSCRNLQTSSQVLLEEECKVVKLSRLQTHLNEALHVTVCC